MADPIRRFRKWHREAEKAGIGLPDACALATADEDGRPSVRFVLLKEADERGFTFYTNTMSRKGVEIGQNPHAALAFYWHDTDRQVRVEGRLEQVSRQEADEYWEERPRESRLASLASIQSAPMEGRRQLLDRYRELQAQYEEGPIPRPPHWTGYRLIPERIEFWTREEPRLHHRELFIRRGDGWQEQLLQP
jgi:pyridoxamine 5'-phosphate oxidase